MSIPAGGEAAVAASAKALFDRFFPTAAARSSLRRALRRGWRSIAAIANVVILTNAPETARELRGGWLRQHSMDYPMILNSGPKGPAVKALAARTQCAGDVRGRPDLQPRFGRARSADR